MGHRWTRAQYPLLDELDQVSRALVRIMGTHVYTRDYIRWLEREMERKERERLRAQSITFAGMGPKAPKWKPKPNSHAGIPEDAKGRKSLNAVRNHR